MSEQKSKTKQIPQRRNPPIYPAYFAFGMSPSEDIAIVDIMDQQHVEPNVSFFSFILTREKAEVLSKALDNFLKKGKSSDE